MSAKNRPVKLELSWDESDQLRDLLRDLLNDDVADLYANYVGLYQELLPRLQQADSDAWCAQPKKGEVRS